MSPFEADVFEQCDMSRTPPVRALDLEINRREGEIPQHRQASRVVVHHKGERESTSAYSASVLFTPKPGGTIYT